MVGPVNSSSTSDEPARLEQLIAKIFAVPPSAPPVRVSDSAEIRIIEGADAQDDCAVFGLRGEQELVVGSDYVRGPKFRLYELGLLDEYDLGYYLVAANLSDIAAMGAHPFGLLSVVRYPPNMTDEVFASVLTGIRDACDRFSAPNVGGDIGGAERLILSATALGVCKPGHAILRRGARPGDRVCLTAATGVAGAAMEYFKSKRPEPLIEARYRDALLSAWKRPQARISEGVLLGESGLVTSCQDTSDGLKAAAESIAAASGVGLTIDEIDLPIPEAVVAVSSHLDREPLPMVMGDSVDFELLFTVPSPNIKELRSLFTSHDLEFFEIGTVTDDRATVLRQRNGALRNLPGAAWRHAPDAPGGR